MGRKQLSTHDAGDVIWVCRHLAAALQGDATILQALDTVLPEAPAGPKSLLSAMRENLVTEATVGRGLIGDVPSFIWGTMLSGELYGAPAPALVKLADRLEVERTTGPVKHKQLYAHSLAIGRLGLMLQVRVPILSALEAAAESASVPEVRDALFAARAAVSDGADLSEALCRVAADLPPAAIDMIRDAEKAGRLPEALPVVSDYLLDEAGGSAAPKGKEKH
jgi:type II secretory pathway component PulF